MAVDDRIKVLYDKAEPVRIGTRLRRLRTGFALSQSAIARLLDIRANAFNQFENGISRPSLDAAIKMKALFDVPLDWVYFGDESGLSRRAADAISEGQSEPMKRSMNKVRKPTSYANKRTGPAKRHGG